MAASQTDIEDFLAGPLVSWVSNFLLLFACPLKTNRTFSICYSLLRV